MPSSGTAGRPRSDDRVVLNGIVWKLRMGSAWRDVPERYGDRAGPPARRRREKGSLDRDEAGEHALGRSRGGLSTKVHLACDGRGRPLGFVLTGGNRNDGTRFEAVMADIRPPSPSPRSCSGSDL
nr:transposase [Streptomyces sp. TLI_235]